MKREQTPVKKGIIQNHHRNSQPRIKCVWAERFYCGCKQFPQDPQFILEYILDSGHMSAAMHPR